MSEILIKQTTKKFKNGDFIFKEKNYLIFVFKNNFLHGRKNKNIFEIQG